MLNLEQTKSAARLFVRHPDYFLRVLYERCKPIISCRLGRHGVSAYPTTLIFFLTYRCNLRCKMCGLWGANGTAIHTELEQDRLTAAEYGEIIRQAAFCRPTITLFGGEPLLHRDWDAIAQHVKEAGLRCRVVTNGLLLEKHAARIVELGIDKVNVSIDGPPAVHDEIRGERGGFERAVKGIQAVADSQKRSGASTPLISITCTVSQFNHAYLLDLAEAVRDLPLSSLVFQHLTFLDQATYEAHHRIFSRMFGATSEVCKGFVIAHENLDPQVLIAQLHRLSHMRCRFPILFRPDFSPREIVDYYTDPLYRRRTHLGCVAPWREAHVMPDGSLTPCLGYVVGNLRQAGLRDLWNNEKFRRFREAVKKHGRFPFCHRCCN
jgi:MoaA/NifB/PqqE/SkfB family radical SAM enzyme